MAFERRCVKSTPDDGFAKADGERRGESRCGRPRTRWAPRSALAIVLSREFVRAVSDTSSKRQKPGASAGGATQDAVKTIACGTPDVSGVFVVTTLVCFFIFAHEAADAWSIRRSARPQWGRRKA